MNIFFVDLDPAICARRLMDSHIRKMTLESLQLLYTHIGATIGRAVFSERYPIEVMRDHLVPDNTELLRVGENLLNYKEQKIRYFRLLNSSKKRIFYRKTHLTHACRRWLGRSAINIIWLLAHFEALCEEFERRFDKKHACEAHLDNVFGLLHNVTEYLLETPWLLAVPGGEEEAEVTKEVLRTLSQYRFDASPRKAMRMYSSLASRGILIHEIPLVVGSTLLKVLAETNIQRANPGQVPMATNLSMAIHAYNTIYLDKLPRLKGNTFTKDSFGVKVGWEAERSRLINLGKHIYVVSTNGMLHNTLYNIDIPQDCVVVLKETTSVRAPFVIDSVYTTIRTYLVGQDGVLDFMRILKGEPEKPPVTPIRNLGDLQRMDLTWTTPPFAPAMRVNEWRERPVDLGDILNDHIHTGRAQIPTEMIRGTVELRPTDDPFPRHPPVPRATIRAELEGTPPRRITADLMEDIANQADRLGTLRMGNATILARRLGAQRIGITVAGQGGNDRIGVEVDDEDLRGTAIKVHLNFPNLPRPIARTAHFGADLHTRRRTHRGPVLREVQVEEDVAPPTWIRRNSYTAVLTIDAAEWTRENLQVNVRGRNIVHDIHVEAKYAIHTLLTSVGFPEAEMDILYEGRYTLIQQRILEALDLLREEYIIRNTTRPAN